VVMEIMNVDKFTRNKSTDNKYNKNLRYLCLVEDLAPSQPRSFSTIMKKEQKLNCCI
jgi:hypothetical protein